LLSRLNKATQESPRPIKIGEGASSQDSEAANLIASFVTNKLKIDKVTGSTTLKAQFSETNAKGIRPKDFDSITRENLYRLSSKMEEGLLPDLKRIYGKDNVRMEKG
jgi:hypothetical protein